MAGARTIERSRVERDRVWLVCLAGWLVPGMGHFWLGQRQKAFVLIVVLPLMFGLGLALDGRIFPFELSEPLVALAAAADVGIGLPYFVAWVAGLGGGLVVADTYEYGNTFLIVAGLLNVLVILDVYDVAIGRK